MSGSLVILTGASGAGKTTLALEIERTHPEFRVLRFDTIGVPSVEVMATFGEDYQPGGAWQRAMTMQWMERIAPVVQSGQSVLFEGQMRIAFITEALSLRQIPNTRIILVECDRSTRERRLIHDRRQPELADENMEGWSQYLHDEAEEAGLEILDTGKRTLAQSVAHIAEYLQPSGQAGA